MENEKRRCLIIDGQPTVRLGVRRLLSDRYEVEEAVDGRQALSMITALGEFDVAVVELGARSGSSRMTGVGAIRALRRAKPGLGIVAHGSRPERHAASEAIDAGATGYVLKSSPPESLEAAIESAAESESFVDPGAKKNGGPELTPRQRETLQHYADGRSTAEVAERLGVTTETVRTHTKGLLARLEARDRAHAVAIGLRSSLIE